MGKITGNVVGIPNPQSDWNQLDATKADFIKNKPTVLTEDDVLDLMAKQGGGDGLSAYEVALKNGFEGTEEEWLASLEGADGVGINYILISDDEESRSTAIFIYDTEGNGDSGLVRWGKDGHTPQKGTDYWTDADKAEIKSYVDDAILGGAW